MDNLIPEDSTRKKLSEIENELSELQKREQEIRGHWLIEKSIIQRIRKYKADIEQFKLQAENAEREGNFALVAEIRYGKIHGLETKLKEANEELAKVQAEVKLLKEEVDAEDIAEIVSKWTGIPVSRMMETERMKLLKMEERIHQRVISQEEAVSAVANALRRSRAGLADENRPIGSFIFLGTTGVGKTEMARALAEFLFDDDQAIVRIDMSEYMEKFAVSRLIGAPPGYVGYEEGGQLTEAIRQRPYAVVLLDEIEKADTEVYNVLLQVLDEGRLTDGKGRTVNFKNTIIIMTSNIGTELIQDKMEGMTDENRDEILSGIRLKIIDMLRKRMRPEFLNRIDEIVLFKPLIGKEIKKIAELQLDELMLKLEKRGIEISFTDDAIDWISKIGYDPQFGARPLKRAIQKHLTDPLSMMILAGEIVKGERIEAAVGDNGKFIFTKL